MRRGVLISSVGNEKKLLGQEQNCNYWPF